jgi:hypothetical protein
MKSDTILMVGVLAIGGYAVYRIMNAATKGIETGTTGLGTGISQISQGISSPYEYLDAYLGARQATDTQRQSNITEIYRYSETVKGLQEQQVTTQEQSKLNVNLTGESKTKTTLNVQDYRAGSTTQSLMNTNANEIQRKDIYGTNPKQTLGNIFMPTPTDINARKEFISDQIVSTAALAKQTLTGLKQVITPTTPSNPKAAALVKTVVYGNKVNLTQPKTILTSFTKKK